MKTNIGHLESAAGVAGVIKTILAMKHGVIPKHLHFRTPNPEMDWDRLPLRVTAEPTPWPVSDDHPPTAGVSGFGWSGTNAHVVLEGYDDARGAAVDASSGHWAAGAARSIPVATPESIAPSVAVTAPETIAQPAAASTPETIARSAAGAMKESTAQPIAGTMKERVAQPRSPWEGLGPRESRFLPLSGRSDAALRKLAGQYLSWLDERAGELASDASASEPLLSDLAWTAGTGRSHFDHRAGVVFRDLGSLREGLRALVEADEAARPRSAAKVAFAYTGQASQWVGMGGTLYRSEPVARSVLDRCDALLREDRDGASLLDVMFGRPGEAGDLDVPMWWSRWRGSGGWSAVSACTIAPRTASRVCRCRPLRSRR